MSADNSICVLQSRGSDGRPEFRVRHVQNVEEASYDDVRVRDEYLRSYFSDCVVFRKQSKALNEAMRQLQQEYYVEYGIVHVNIGGPFPALATAAAKKPVRYPAALVPSADSVICYPESEGQAQAAPGGKAKARKQRSRLYRQVDRLQRKTTAMTHQVNWLTFRVKELEALLASK